MTPVSWRHLPLLHNQEGIRQDMHVWKNAQKNKTRKYKENKK
jgi:hypothetical protein